MKNSVPGSHRMPNFLPADSHKCRYIFHPPGFRKSAPDIRNPHRSKQVCHPEAHDKSAKYICCQYSLSPCLFLRLSDIRHCISIPGRTAMYLLSPFRWSPVTYELYLLLYRLLPGNTMRLYFFIFLDIPRKMYYNRPGTDELVSLSENQNTSHPLAEWSLP